MSGYVANTHAPLGGIGRRDDRKILRISVTVSIWDSYVESGIL